MGGGDKIKVTIILTGGSNPDEISWQTIQSVRSAFWGRRQPPARKIIRLLLAMIVVLNVAGCVPAFHDHQPTVNPPPHEEAGTAVPGSGDRSVTEDGDLQAALNLLFTWQPEWEAISKQGRRAIEGGFATMVIDLAEKPEAGIYILHVYDIVEYPEGEHTCTFGWYEVNCNRAVIYDQVLNERVY